MPGLRSDAYNCRCCPAYDLFERLASFCPCHWRDRKRLGWVPVRGTGERSSCKFSEGTIRQHRAEATSQRAYHCLRGDAWTYGLPRSLTLIHNCLRFAIQDLPSHGYRRLGLVPREWCVGVEFRLKNCTANEQL